MKRRCILLAGAVGLVFAPARLFAQQPSAKIPRIGVLSPADSDKAATLEAFRSGLRDLALYGGARYRPRIRCVPNAALTVLMFSRLQ